MPIYLLSFLYCFAEESIEDDLKKNSIYTSCLDKKYQYLDEYCVTKDFSYICDDTQNPGKYNLFFKKMNAIHNTHS